jgi:hypothetical protein
MDKSVNCLSLDSKPCTTNLQGLDVFHLLRNSIQVQQSAGVNISHFFQGTKNMQGEEKRRGKD